MKEKTAPKIEKKENPASIAILAMFVISVEAVFAKYSNPDSDAFFLIATGREILRNGFPKTNPFVTTEGLGIIIQQPLCAILNYLFCNRFQLDRLWMLGAIEGVVRYLCIAWMNYQFSGNKTKGLCTATVAECIMLASYGATTRPYSITSSAIAILIGALERSRKKGAIPFTAVVLTSLFVANYQSASISFVWAAVAAFAAEDFFSGQMKKIAAWTGALASSFAVSILNPYGIKGVAYLYLSQKMLSGIKNGISEMRAPAIISTTGIVLIAGFIFLKIRERGSSAVSFIYTGSAMLSAIASRNLWTLVLATSCLISASSLKSLADKLGKSEIGGKLKAKGKEEERYSDNSINNKKRAIRLIRKTSVASAAIAMGLVLAFTFLFAEPDRINNAKECITIVQTVPKDAKIYTTFNTGGYAEYTERKAYIDSRPELFADEIAGKGKGIWNDWLGAHTSIEKAEELLGSGEWDYALVEDKDMENAYLYYSGKGDLVGSSQNGVRLYKINK